MVILAQKALLCLTLAVYQEARGEPTIAQVGVAQVVLARHIKSNKTVCQVLKEPSQFPWAKRRIKVREPKAFVESEKIAKAVLYKKTRCKRLKGKYLFFNHHKAKPIKSNLPPVRIGKLLFT